MNLFGVVGAALIAVVLILLVREYRPEFAVAISLLTGVLIFLSLLKPLSDLMAALEGMWQLFRQAEPYFILLVKVIGVAMVTQLAVDTCRDAGQQSIATKVEIAGRVTILSLSLPLFQELLAAASQMIG